MRGVLALDWIKSYPRERVSCHCRVRPICQGAQVWRRLTGAVTCGRAADDGLVEIVVRDDGRGIPADQLLHIFEPFVQVGRRLSGSDAGAGLGLAISRELARSMGRDHCVEHGRSRIRVHRPPAWSRARRVNGFCSGRRR